MTFVFQLWMIVPLATTMFIFGLAAHKAIESSIYSDDVLIYSILWAITTLPALLAIWLHQFNV